MATTDKYDRQIRLWGAHGQRALMDARVLLIGCGAAGTETMKNMVLPGVGHITLLSDATTTLADAGVNWFVREEDVGRPLAEVTLEQLLEMNEDVSGEARVASISSVLDEADGPAWLSAFTLVVFSDNSASPDVVERVAALLWEAGVPLLRLRSYGLIGEVRLAVAEHTVVEAKPMRDTQDLRIVNPWPELAAYFDGWELDSLDSLEHSHVPYPVLLYKASKAYREAHDGALPKKTAEKDELRGMLAALARHGMEENFAEAKENAYRAYVRAEVSCELRDVLDDDRATSLTASSSDFWFLVSALRTFVDGVGDGALPMRRAFPDMTATTEAYLAIQSIYQAKAAADVAAVSDAVAAALTSVGRSADAIEAATISTFCENAAVLHVLRTRSLAEEAAAPATDELSMQLMIAPGDQCAALWHVMLLAVDAFHREHGRLPGAAPAGGSELEAKEAEADTAPLLELAKRKMEELSLDASALKAGHAREMVRAGGAEMHATSAYLGGVASQECIKLLTHQYLPIDNCFIWVGINATAVVIAL